MLNSRAERLGEPLGAFELGRRLARAERLDAGRLEIVDHPGRQRRLRADHDEIDLVALAELDHRGMVGDIERDAFGFPRDAGIAGRAPQFVSSGEAAIFHASACSRPPEPSRRMFMKCSQMRGCGAASVARVRLCLQGEYRTVVIPDGAPCARSGSWAWWTPVAFAADFGLVLRIAPE